MPPRRHNAVCAGLALILALIPLGLEAQGLQDLLVTSGVHTRDASGRPMAYLVWGAADPTLLNGRVFAIYLKAGIPGAPTPAVRQQIVLPAPDSASAAASLARGQMLSPDAPGAGPLVAILLKGAGLPPSNSTEAGLAQLVRVSGTNLTVRGELESFVGTVPGIALALGRAWSGVIPEGISTLELREWDALTGRDLRPVGRVTLDTAQVSALPAPGGPVQVPDLTPAGNLLVRLRWAVPPTLRRREPLQLGFNVWRLPRGDAARLGYLARSPSLAELTTNGRRINDLPIVITKHFEDASVANFAADPATWFYTDSNGRFEEGGTSFPDGAEFAYFITARDLLGRDGIPSRAGLGIACVTAPPNVPQRVETANILHAPSENLVRQAIQISWLGATGATGFELFRSLDPAALRVASPAPSLRIARVPGTGVGDTAIWVDDLLAAGPIPAGQAFFYAVRSLRQTACGEIASSLTPPAQANWRNFFGPPAPTGELAINCPRPVVRYQGSSRATLPQGSPPLLTNAVGTVLRRHRATIHRRDHGIAWARITASDSSGPVHVSPQIWFLPDEDSLDIDFVRPLRAFPEGGLDLLCDVGTGTGASASSSVTENGTAEIVQTRFESAELAPMALDPADPLASAVIEGGFVNSQPACVRLTPEGRPANDGTLTLLRDRRNAARYWVQDRTSNPPRTVGVFHAPAEPDTTLPPRLTIRDPALATWTPQQPLPEYCGSVLEETRPSDAGPAECVHLSHPSGSDAIQGVGIRAILRNSAREFRLYRRINDGILTLLSQGPVPRDPTRPELSLPVLRTDAAMPESGGTLCYFIQAIDADGNGSVMTPLGCTAVSGGPLPLPILSRPEPAGDAAQPQMRLSWMCAPEGVERFEVFLHAEASSKTITSPSPGGSGAAYSVLKTVKDPPLAVHRTRDPFGAVVQVSVPSDRILTDPVGSARLGGGPGFGLLVNVEEGVRYTVFLRALSAGPTFLARRGDPSFSYSFTWRRSAGADSADVPWPPRPLPPVARFHPDAIAMQVPGFARLWPTNADEAPVGVRIGRLVSLARDVTDRSAPMGTYYPLATLPRSLPIAAVDPNLALFAETLGPAPRTNLLLLPAVLYRQQVTNAAFPRVSGDLVQVSPLIGAVSWETRLLGNDLQGAWLTDPFVFVSRHLVNGDVTGGPPDLWIMDSHPVVQGARYRYSLVRFTRSGEPDSIIPAGEVEIQ